MGGGCVIQTQLPALRTKPRGRDVSASSTPPWPAFVTTVGECAWCTCARTTGRWLGASLAESPSRERALTGTQLWTPEIPFKRGECTDATGVQMNIEGRTEYKYIWFEKRKKDENLSGLSVAKIAGGSKEQALPPRFEPPEHSEPLRLSTRASPAAAAFAQSYELPTPRAMPLELPLLLLELLPWLFSSLWPSCARSLRCSAVKG